MSNKKNGYNPYSSGIKTAVKDDEKRSILFWGLNIITLIFLFWAPFQKGLFNGNNFDFERPIYSSIVWSCIILFLTSIFCFYKWALFKISDLLVVLVWLIPVTYLISSSFAASHYYASNMLLIQVSYVSFFLIGYFLSKNNVGLLSLTNGLMISGYVIVWFGIFNWFGQKLTVYQDVIMSDATGVRLTSVFQYANAYAAFLIALLLGSVYLASSSKKWLPTILHSFMAIPTLISFLLTLSRGALVLFPLIVIVILFVLKMHRQIILLIHLGLATIMSLLILNQVTNIGIEQTKQYNSALTLKGWIILTVVSAIYCLLIFLIQKFLLPLVKKKTEKLRFSSIFIPLGVIGVGILCLVLLFGNTGLLNILPANIKNRIETINFQQNSVLERGTFYKDAMKLFKDYPVMGAGGGAWAALYEKYQNNPYVSRQAHNFFLQYLIEVGIVGFTVFILFLAFIFYIFIRNYSKQDEETRNQRFIFYIIAVSLLIHSMIDFDLSYVYLGMILFLCLGAMISNDSTELKGAWKDTVNRYKWSYPSIVLILSLVLFFNAVQLLSANTQFNKAMAQANTSKNMNDIITPLNKALDLHPNHPDYTGLKIDLLLQAYNQTKDDRFYNDAVSLIDKTRQKEPFNRLLIEKEIYALAVKEQLPKALDLINQEINNFPWDISLYEKGISVSTDLGNKARTDRNNQLRDKYWSQAFETYNTVQEKMKELAALPKGQVQGREFNVTKNMGLSLGQIEFMRGNYASAEGFLRIGLDGNLDDQVTRIVSRWYLAALERQGKNDQALYDKLVAKDPNERQEILNLVNARF